LFTQIHLYNISTKFGRLLNRSVYKPTNMKK
jgi:hypothetical protein